MLEQEEALVYEAGQWQIHLGRRELRERGMAIVIGNRAFEIFEVLVRAANELVTKEYLMDRIWPGAIVGESTIHVHISAIRKALGQDRGMLKTVSGRGYRLVGDWTVRRNEASAPPVGMQQPPTTTDIKTNFPAAIGRLIGRSQAVQQLRDLVSAYRVVTLTGPGGIGKTTLALEVGHTILSEFSHGARLVELAPLTDPDLVPSAVAQALGLKLGAEQISAEAVASAIAGRHLLLLLDNCEHVIEAAANLAQVFVRSCPRITILATSREILRIDSECVYRVLPLEVPALGQREAGDILHHSAVELFLSRIQATGSDFSTDGRNLLAIAAICRRLDGIPLAITFAAARAAALGIEYVATSLRDHLALLNIGRRNAVHRHRTLRGTFDWSYELLPEPEQLLLRRLSVFPAGFTLEAAQAVIGGSGLVATSVIEGIANLVEKSLVVLNSSEASGRWYMLETVRSYALEKLEQHGETEHATRCHAIYFRDFFKSATADFRRPVAVRDRSGYGRELDNVRAALDWCFSSKGDSAIGVDLTASYAWVWGHLSLLTECCERCERALLSLEAGPQLNPWVRLQLRMVLGVVLMFILGPSDRSRNVMVDALGDADELDDLDAQAQALWALVPIYNYRGENYEAWGVVQRLRDTANRIGDPSFILISDRAFGNVLLTAGQLREARQCFERVVQSPYALDDRRRSNWNGSEHRAVARAGLARTLLLQGFAKKAHAEAIASLSDLHDTDSQHSVCRIIYDGLGRIALMTGDTDTAERSIARLIAVATALNSPFWANVGRFLEGKAMIERGAFAAGLMMLRDAFGVSDRTGWRISYSEFKGAFAVGLAGVGQASEALAAVDEGIVSSGRREGGQQWYLPELLRIKGEVLLQFDPDRFALTAEACFDQAAQKAAEQGALFWELRIALSLARLRLKLGDHRNASRTLAPVYDRFTEGFETSDLRAARAILDGGLV